MLPFTLLLTENWDIHFNWLGFFGLIYLGVVCSWFAFWLWNKGLNSVDAKISGILTALEPIFGVFGSIITQRRGFTCFSAWDYHYCGFSPRRKLITQMVT